MNEVVGYAVNVPRNADRINKTENQHDPERDAREKVKHAEEVAAVQNACRERDDVPACVRKDPGICLRTLDRDQITRRSWHSFSPPCVGIHSIDRQIQPEIFLGFDLKPLRVEVTLQKGQIEQR